MINSFEFRVQERCPSRSSETTGIQDAKKLQAELGSHRILNNYKATNDMLLRELDEKRSCLIGNSHEDVFPLSKPKSMKSARKRRVYSEVHLDPKKSGRRFRANDRERRRMESLNSALNALKGCIPMPKSSKRMTKLRVLRCACNYIRSLSEVLEAATGRIGYQSDSMTSNREKSINGLSIGQRLDILSHHASRFYQSI